jgi:hypothetical protein
MKTVLFIAVALITFSVVLAFASCPKGCEEHQGTCACDQAPAEFAPSVVPSNEKPPRSGQLSQDAVEASTQASLTYQDAQHDQEIKDADTAGKTAAGIK